MRRLSVLAVAAALAAPCAGSSSSKGTPGVSGLPTAITPSIAPLSTLPTLDAGLTRTVAPLGATISALPQTALPVSAFPGAQAASVEAGASGESALVPISPTAAQPAVIAAQVPEGAPSGAPAGLGGRVGRIISSVLSAFGSKKPDEPPPQSEAQRLDREFANLDLWGRIAPSVRGELASLQARKLGKAAMREYVQAEAEKALEAMKRSAGSANLGFHFNLHGGRRDDYVGQGIRATMGDIALNYSTHGDRNYKVYFFQSQQHSLFALLDEGNPAILLFPSRMGHVLNIFKLDAPEIEAAKAAGRIRNHGAISMDFHGMNGVPYSAYTAPPLEVFNGTKRKLGVKRLSRDEETLATIRFLEAAVAAGAPYIPKP